MQASYTGYALVKREADGSTSRSLFDINVLLDSFLSEDVNFRKNFKIGEENAYIIGDGCPNTSKAFLFVVTKDNEIAKAVNSSNLNVEDIRYRLNEDERLGFASYFYTGKSNCLAFMSKIYSPRIDLLAFVLNEYLSIILGQVGLYKIILAPFMVQSHPEELQSMSFIGKTDIEITRNHEWFSYLAKLLWGDVSDENISRIEIIIRPCKGKNIKNNAIETLRGLDDETTKFIARAKSELQPFLTDLYLAGNGRISDKINLRDTRDPNLSEIERKVAEKVDNNDRLNRELSLFRDDAFQQEVADCLYRALKERGKHRGEGALQ